jgi:lipopolysaccharide exporter
MVLLANQLSSLGVGPYVLSRTNVRYARDFAAHVFHVGTGIVALGIVTASAGPLTNLCHAPHAASFVAAMAAVVMIDRIGYVPERVVLKHLRFRVVALARAAGEVTNSVVTFALALMGYGGWSIIGGNVVRSVTRVGLFLWAVDKRAWLTSRRPSFNELREIVRFGVPAWLGSVSEFAATRTDNLAMSYLYGPRVMAEYQVAYNLADVPADQIGEQVAEALLPSFARMSLDERKRALVASAGLLSFVVFPMAIGLGAVAPTLIHVVLRPAWFSVAPMLTVLCVLSIMRPLTWQLNSYFYANQRPRIATTCSVVKVTVLMLLMLTAGRRGVMWACLSVGTGYVAALTIGYYSVWRDDGISPVSILRRTGAALAACIPMVIAVVGARHVAAGAGLRAGGILAWEIGTGIIGFGFGARMFARSLLDELVNAIRATLGEPGKLS